MSLFLKSGVAFALLLGVAYAQEDPSYPFKTMADDLAQARYQNIEVHFTPFLEQCRADGANGRNLAHYYRELWQWKNVEALKKMGHHRRQGLDPPRRLGRRLRQ